MKITILTFILCVSCAKQVTEYEAFCEKDSGSKDCVEYLERKKSVDESFQNIGPVPVPVPVQIPYVLFL